MAVYSVTTGVFLSKAPVCFLALVLMSATLLAGCSTSAPYSADRSDKQTVRAYPRPTKTATIPRWRPGGPGDTDGKPGEPNCPDCDFNGPVYIGSERPRR